MAIINAKRVTVIGLCEDRPEVVKSLQSLGAVQIEANTFSDVDVVETTEGVTQTEQRLADIKFALTLLKPYDESKKPFLEAKPAIDQKGLEAFKELERKQMIAVDSLKELSEELNWARASISRAKNLILQVEPYRNFDDTFSALGTHIYTSATVGVMPIENKDALIQLMEENDGLASYEILEEMQDTFIVFVLTHNDITHEIKTTLKTLGFSEAKYEQFTDSPEGIIDAHVKEIAALSEKKAEIKMQIAAFVGQIPDMERLEDYYNAMLQRERAALSFGYTKNAFVLEGWTDEHSQEAVQKAVAEVSETAIVQFRDPIEGESYPTIIENPKLARPFEAITEMYDTPSAGGIDPNLLMAPFYFIVFGMMVSDAGYGLVLALACTFILWKTKPAGMFGKILGVVAFGGVSTLIWGALFGGWFGVSVENLPKALQFLTHLKWFNPMEEPLTMLALCLGIGTFQVLFGLGVAAGINIKRHKPFAALFDQVSWMLVIIGLLAMLPGGIIGKIGGYTALAGAGLVLLFAGREKKSIIGKLMGGLSALYGATGYLSDILSYSRIFGMGLATGVIALVFNTIAGMLFGKWFMIPFAVVILVVGHVFNIGINTLGAYVHSCRLQYIEYYGKFFEGGGKTFRPLRTDIKHYRFEK